MRVLVVFEPAFTGDPLDAVWIIDTPQNRAWYEKQLERIDGNSAVFTPANDPVDILWHVFEHHPRWTEIVVRGAELASDLAKGVKPEAVVRAQGADEFTLARPE